jgi:hypothetical protein
MQEKDEKNEMKDYFYLKKDGLQKVNRPGSK